MATALGSPVGSTATTSTGLNSLGQQYLTPLLDKAAQQLQTPYQAYGGQRVAGTSDLQNQALSGIAGLQAYNPIQYQTQSFNDPGVAQSYMSPYQQGVTDIAAREANRQADIQQTQLGQAGAGTGFGDRFRLVQAEGDRNRAQLLNDIQTKGLQSAYTAGQGQFNTENLNNLRMQEAQNQANYQGYGTGVNALNTQLNAGALPRDINQQNLDVGFQNYQTQQAYPWKQIQNAQQAFSGVPMTNTTAYTKYDSPGAAQQVLGGAGLALNNWDNLGNMFKGVGSLFNGYGGSGPSASDMAKYSNDAAQQMSSGFYS
jgi:hypothetical protein